MDSFHASFLGVVDTGSCIAWVEEDRHRPLAYQLKHLQVEGIGSCTELMELLPYHLPVDTTKVLQIQSLNHHHILYYLCYHHHHWLWLFLLPSKFNTKDLHPNLDWYLNHLLCIEIIYQQGVGTADSTAAAVVWQPPFQHQDHLKRIHLQPCTGQP